MRTMLIDDTDHAATVAERKQLLAHHDDLFWRAVRLGQFFGKQYRQPEAAQQLAHRRSRAGLGQEFIVLCAEHGGPPDYFFSTSLAQVARVVNVELPTSGRSDWNFGCASAISRCKSAGVVAEILRARGRGECRAHDAPAA